MLGFYMSSHPLTRYAQVLQTLATHRVADLGGVAEGTEVVLGGMIVGVQLKSVSKSRSGLTRMGKLTFEDLSGAVPAMLWPEEFAKFEELVKNDQIVFVRGKLDRRRDPAELIISKIIPLANGPGELSRGVVVTLRKGLVDEQKDLESLLRKIRIRPGNLDVYLEILGLAGVRRAIYRVGPSLKIRYDDQLVADLEATVQAGNVRLVGHRGATARVEPTPSREASSSSSAVADDYTEPPSDDSDDL
ncbi:MAG: OB-fold nucleic acid binding domain-containing protein [Isosphaeraceae bacterium]